ncbi:heterokaryon incompatibility protein-domain-containing protein [Xylaria telfairii]|nr:heterokaryon incompatibility protein-domain-containing protein [Xylaria telfairii]
MPALQFGCGSIRRVYSMTQNVWDVGNLAPGRYISLCLVSTILTFLLTIYGFSRAGGLRIVLQDTKTYTFFQEATLRFMLRAFTYNARPCMYPLLDQANSAIRLLSIHSIDEVWGIKSLKLVNIRLISCPVALAPPFAAVSYRCTSGHPVPIMVGRRRLEVSRSIHQLLITLQSEINDGHDDRYFWIDAICINQGDSKEKSWQTALMKNIYRSATHVIGWLGLDAPPVSTWRGIGGVQDAVDIICNDFFSRTWIIQEISLAQNVVIRTRHDACLWDGGVVGAVRRHASSFSPYGESKFGVSLEMMPRVSRGIKYINGMESFRARIHAHPGGLPISELLVRSIEFQCSDPRDRIYSLLGLATKNARSAIPVKYHRTNLELDATIQAVRFSLMAESSFQLLELSGAGMDLAGPPVREASERTSWVPDWQSPHLASMRKIMSHSKSHATAIHRPCHVKLPTKTRSRNDVKSLRVEGAIFDTVKEMITTTWILPKTCDFRDKEGLTQISDVLDKLDMVLEIARGDRVLDSSVAEKDHNAILRTVASAGSLISAENPNFDPVCVTLEQLSRDLRAHVASTKDQARQGRTSDTDLGHFILGLEEFMPLIFGRRLCVTEKGHFAIVPPLTTCGDRICAFSGAPNPFVLCARNASNATPRAYQLGGACCVDQVMGGELARANLNWEILRVV